MTVKEVELAVTAAEGAKEKVQVQLTAAGVAVMVARLELREANTAWVQARRALYQAQVEALEPPGPVVRLLVEGRWEYTRAIAVEQIVSDTIFEGRMTGAEQQGFEPPSWGSRKRFSTATGYARRNLEEWIAHARKGGPPIRLR